MFHDRLLHVADVVEAGSIEGLGFNMGAYHPEQHFTDYGGRNAERAGCLAAWTVHIAAKLTRASDLAGIPVRQTAQAWLGLDDDQTYELFSIWPPHATPAEGAQAMRSLAETGAVKWPREPSVLNTPFTLFAAPVGALP